MKAAVLSSLLFFVQGFPAPGQDVASGSIGGTVVRLGTGSPISRAEVTLRSDREGRDLGRVTTDVRGRFRFDDLPPGTYRIFAARNGFVQTEFGQRRPDRPGDAVSLAVGQERGDLVVPITPTGAISGRITDENGEPVAFAQVQAHRYTFENGRRVITPVQTVQTNDLGEYRLFWLQPGEYVVGVVPSGQASPVFFASGPDGVVFGTSPSPGGAAALGFQPGANVIVRTPIDRASFQVAPVFEAPGSTVPRSSDEAYVPVYYPGTTDPQFAGVIDLPAGAEFGGVDLRVEKIRAVGIRGRVVLGQGGDLPPGVLVRLVGRDTVRGSSGVRIARVATDGAFEFTGVVPGRYDLTGSISSGIVQTVTIAGPGAGFEQAASVPTSLFGLSLLEVGAADIENLTLELAPGFDLTGRVGADAPGVALPSDLSGLEVRLRAEPTLYGVGLEAAVPQADGAFAIESLPPGTYWLTVSGLPSGAYVRDARLGAADAWNAPIQIQGDPRAALDIRIGTDAGSLDVAVFSGDQERTPDVRVVLVPEVARRGRTDAYHASWSDASGNVRFEDLPPGEYKVFAWDAVEEGAWQNPDFIRQTENLGVPVAISQGAGATAIVSPILSN